MRAFRFPLRLDIYLDKENKAKGLLYLDDGESFNHQQNQERTLVEFDFDGTTLSVKALLRDSFYEIAFEMFVTEINIYGIDKSPTTITNLYLSSGSK